MKEKGTDSSSFAATGYGTADSMPRQDAINARARLLRAIRNHFEEAGYVETPTPVVISAPAPEEYIECPLGGRGFLRASPELEMKRLLAAGLSAIYQIGPCFREGEIGRHHNDEFTMLEWYRAGQTYLDILDFTKGLLAAAVNPFYSSGICRFRGGDIDFREEWEILTVDEAFERYAETDPESAIRADRFEETLVERIEPYLGFGRPSVLIDYPAHFASLARRKTARPDRAERWELYLGGVEIANAYGELTDPAEQRQRFRAAAEARAANGFRAYPEPVEFFSALDRGIPDCAGCALGLDRLLMILLDADSIREILVP